MIVTFAIEGLTPDRRLTLRTWGVADTPERSKRNCERQNIHPDQAAAGGWLQGKMPEKSHRIQINARGDTVSWEREATVTDPDEDITWFNLAEVRKRGVPYGCGNYSGEDILPPKTFSRLEYVRHVVRKKER
ncbi:hypothetical protein CMI37_30265 [Candidatus Pacearchaeota archaeon]|nr:hypothetical protein [Candidatus Pacearchaeota archaeon]|tara:strand:+ start:805 stop:1200 length:396 start_codon:yes stop_codon:yes gene_type:complete